MFRVEEKNMQKQTDQQNADTDTRNRLYDTIAQQPKRKPLKEREKNLQQHNNKDDEPKINDDVTTQQFLMKISSSKLPTKNFFMCMCASV